MCQEEEEEEEEEEGEIARRGGEVICMTELIWGGRDGVRKAARRGDYSISSTRAAATDFPNSGYWVTDYLLFFIFFLSKNV